MKMKMMICLLNKFRKSKRLQNKIKVIKQIKISINKQIK